MTATQRLKSRKRQKKVSSRKNSTPSAAYFGSPCTALFMMSGCPSSEIAWKMLTKALVI